MIKQRKMGKRAVISCVGAIIEKNKKSVITTFDVIRTMNCKVPVRCPSRPKRENLAPWDVERDLKLMTSILGIEHYTLIMLGAITEYPMLYTPWLLMQLCVIIVEIIVFFVRLFLDGLHVKRDEILPAILMVHNWLQVFCLFHRQARNSIQ
ncbi:uncharacterized protein LOC122631870 isoform X3 [Vespula pensylvanica]|uniref:uncharacterized protein LOC122631870 isoform X3 n=1 Tax=Vespula pensylvanica TaxID=30213 RepID=UPI001CBA568A|nr:uncharacterized protein LOC122631870 isoform X3 [Vespula pensylvanica]XP_050856886.1 uncharacterized protein LOC127066780 isoform X3 [Vespula vulgaris]